MKKPLDPSRGMPSSATTPAATRSTVPAMSLESATSAPVSVAIGRWYAVPARPASPDRVRRLVANSDFDEVSEERARAAIVVAEPEVAHDPVVRDEQRHGQLDALAEGAGLGCRQRD